VRNRAQKKGLKKRENNEPMDLKLKGEQKELDLKELMKN
jgi:hypothetical protein